MSTKKIDSFNIHEQPESNTDPFGVETYLNENFKKAKEVINNNADELEQVQKQIGNVNTVLDEINGEEV